MISKTNMSFFRPVLAAIFSLGFTSCQTFHGLMNSFPIRILDGIGSTATSFFGEVPAADGKPASVQDRARQVEGRGIYAGGRSSVMTASRQSMAAR
jgi:hypothetical protein